MTDLSENWIIDDDGFRHQPDHKRDEIWARYLKPCGPGTALTSSPLEDVLKQNRCCTVVEADNQFVLSSHLATALVKRANPEILWDALIPDTLMNRLIDGPPDIQEALQHGLDPLVIVAFEWLRYVKGSEFIGHLIKIRTMQYLPTLFAVGSLSDLSGDPLRFDPGVRQWLYGCPKVSLTVGSILPNARNLEQAKAYLKLHPGFGQALAPVVHTGPTGAEPPGLNRIQLPNGPNPGNLKNTRGGPA